MKSKKILIIAPSKLIGTMSIVIELANFLKKNFSLELIYNQNCNPKLDKRKDILYVPYNFPNTPIIQSIYLLLKLSYKKKINEYQAIILVGQAATIAGFFLGLHKKKTYILHDEIRIGLRKKLSKISINRSLLGNILENYLSSFYEYHIVPDKWRGRVQRKISNYSKQNEFYLPSSLLKKRLKFENYSSSKSKNRNSLIFIGRPKPENIIKAIFKILKNSNYNFVIQARDAQSKETISNLINEYEVEEDRLIFLENPVNFYDLDSIISRGDIGIVAFERDTVNSRVIGYSSGKLNRFLMNGLPCFCSDKNYMGWVEKNGLGICGNIENIESSIEKIFFDYDTFSENAIRFYTKNLVYDDYAEKLRNHIKYYE